MVVEYKRDLSQSDMLIREEGGAADSYELRVLMANRIPGLLHLEVEQVNGETIYRYDITACRPFAVYCGDGRMSAENLRGLYTGLLDTLLSLEDYLLDSSHLLLDPEYLFLSEEEMALRLPYLPSHTCDVREALTAFTEAILMQVDAEQQECIVLACRILRELHKSDLQLLDLRRFLEEDAVSAETEGVPERRRAGAEMMAPGGDTADGGAPANRTGYPAGAEIPANRTAYPAGAEIPANRAGYPVGSEAPYFADGDADADPSGNDIYQRSGFFYDDLPTTDDFDPADGSGLPADKKQSGMAAAVRAQLPERATVRMALIALAPAALFYVFLQLQSFLLLSARESAGMALLVAAVILLICRLVERKKGVVRADRARDG